MKFRAATGVGPYKYDEHSFGNHEQSRARALSVQISGRLKLPTENENYLEHGFKSGEIDHANLWQVSHFHRPRVFDQLEEIVIPKLYLGLLIDCSGSMNCGGRIGNARILAGALAMAVEGHPKVTLTIGGHTTTYGDEVSLAMIKRPDTPYSPHGIARLHACAGNEDGFALWAFGRQMQKHMRHYDHGLILLICDGQPCHDSDIMRNSITEVRHKFKQHTLAIGVGSDMCDSLCTELYGADNYVIVGDPTDSAPAIATAINRAVDRMGPV